MTTQAIGTHSGKRDKRFAAEIYGFVREFQNIKIRVTPENVEECVYAFVHPPYMLQSVSLVENDEKFKQLKERHRARLQRVKEARETTSEAVKGFLDRQFYEGDGREKHIADGRAELADIKKLLQEAVDQELISISRGKKYPDGYDLRRWLYMLAGGSDPSNTDPMAMAPLPGEDWVTSPPHMMILIPGDLDPADFSTDHTSGQPYIMWEGTPYEHLMAPVADMAHQH